MAECGNGTRPDGTGQGGGQAEGAPQVHTLLVELGRKAGDDLPESATGAAMLCYCAARDEAQAVRETVAVLRQAGLAPLSVTGYGTLADRLAEGHDIPEDEQRLMRRAQADNAVIVAQLTPFFEADDG